LVLSASGVDGVKVKIVLVVSCVTIPTTPGATVKVVALMVAGFIALLKVAVITALGQTVAPLTGVTETTLGGVTVGLPALSGSLHPAAKAKMSSRNAVNQIL